MPIETPQKHGTEAFSGEQEETVGDRTVAGYIAIYGALGNPVNLVNY